jgi:hypothetical protein
MKGVGVLLMAAFLVGLLAPTAEAQILTPTAAAANTEYASLVGPRHLIDPARLNDSNRHIPIAWGGNWLAGDRLPTHDNWV